MAQAAIQRDQDRQEKWQEPHEIQKGEEVQSPAPSKEEQKASGCAEGSPAVKQFGRKGFGDAGR